MVNSLTNLSLESLLNTRHHGPGFRGRTHSSLDHFPGPRVGPRRGQGIEFDDLRPYFPGDDIRHIDWNVTARANQPYTRLYREEKEQTTSVVVDLRAPMFTGSRILKAVKAGELAASVLWQACQSGDRCSAVVFSDQGIRATRPLGGHRGVLNACELISDEFSHARSQISEQSGRRPENTIPGLDYLFNWLQIAGRRAGIKLLFTGLEDQNDDWQQPLKALGQQQRLVSILLTDKLETSALPAGYYRYNKQLEVAAVQLDKSSAAQVSAQIQTQIQAIRKIFNSSRVPLIECDSECHATDFLAQLIRYSII